MHSDVSFDVVVDVAAIVVANDDVVVADVLVAIVCP